MKTIKLAELDPTFANTSLQISFERQEEQELAIRVAIGFILTLEKAGPTRELQLVEKAKQLLSE